MTAVPFDTLKLERTLQAQGAFTDAQSSRLVEALGDILASDLVTKPDLRQAELRLETRIAGTEAETIAWFFGVFGVQTLPIIGAVVAMAGSQRRPPTVGGHLRLFVGRRFPKPR